MILLQLEPLSQPTAIIEMLLLLALAAFVGWLLGRLTTSGRISGLRESIAERRAELDDCHASLAVTAPTGVAAPAVSSFAPPIVAASPPSAETVKIATVPPIQSAADNLKLVEGIGPKIEEILNADGIRTFAKLAATDPQHIGALLNAAGARFQIHDPGTWPEQAALARDGKWDELKVLQEKLMGGRD